MRNGIILIPAYKPTYDMLTLINQLIENNFDKIIVVDDGSGEEYTEIFEQIESIKECDLLRHTANCGKGRALKTGFEYARQKYNDNTCMGIVTVDADGQHDIKDIIRVSQQMTKQKVVLGVREFSNDIPFRSKIGNEMTKLVFRILVGLNISDTQTGLRGIGMQILEDLIDIKGERYEYETNMLLYLKKANIRIDEVIIKTIYINENESSHFNPIKDSLKIYSCIFKYALSSIVAFLIDNMLFVVAYSLTRQVLLSLCLGRSISLCTNFFMNKQLVFKSEQEGKKTFLKYCLLAVLNIGFTTLLMEYIAIEEQVQVVTLKIAIETILYFFNFYIQKKYIFKGE